MLRFANSVFLSSFLKLQSSVKWLWKTCNSFLKLNKFIYIYVAKLRNHSIEFILKLVHGQPVWYPTHILPLAVATVLWKGNLFLTQSCQSRSNGRKYTTRLSTTLVINQFPKTTDYSTAFGIYDIHNDLIKRFLKPKLHIFKLAYPWIWRVIYNRAINFILCRVK